jgi:hypothetical protein
VYESGPAMTSKPKGQLQKGALVNWIDDRLPIKPFRVVGERKI